jgi:pSer/pThr/pTyr-binding forkhead associated (FHA) protein
MQFPSTPEPSSAVEQRTDAAQPVEEAVDFSVVPDQKSQTLQQSTIAPFIERASEPESAHAMGSARVRFELLVSLPGKGSAVFELKQGDNIIGRGDGCDITIADPEQWLSRRHANARVSADCVELIDLETRNGTYVDGQRVQNIVLAPGACFVLGPHIAITLEER